MVFGRYFTLALGMVGLVACLDTRTARTGEQEEAISPCDNYGCAASFETAYGNPITLTSSGESTEIQLLGVGRQGMSSLNPVVRASFRTDRGQHALLEGECVDVSEDLGVQVLEVRYEGERGEDSSVAFCVVADSDVRVSQEF